MIIAITIIEVITPMKEANVSLQPPSIKLSLTLLCTLGIIPKNHPKNAAMPEKKALIRTIATSAVPVATAPATFLKMLKPPMSDMPMQITIIVPMPSLIAGTTARSCGKSTFQQ